MTLQELLNLCDFKAIAPIIEKHYPVQGQMTHFKEAFDTLRHLEPKLNPDCKDQEITLSRAEYLDWEKKGKEQDYYICASCWGDFWTSQLAKEIVVSEELTLTHDEIAAHCLWELTFFGNPYIKEEFDETLRKRCHNRREKVEDAIRRLTTHTESFKKEELKYLFKTNRIVEENYRSFAYNPKHRTDYLIDLLSNYETSDFSNYTHFLLMLRTSSAYPLPQHELEILQNIFTQILPASANIRFGYGYDENLGTEVSVFLLGSY
jgi:hypothetical protein